MNSHVLGAVIAGATAVLVAGAAIELRPIEQVVHQVNGSKHAWPDLTEAEKADLAARFKQIPGLKLDIAGADASSVDLSQDIDDAAEQAGIESVLDHAAIPLGYGIGIAAGDIATAQAVADALSAATHGRLKAEIKIDARTYGYAVVNIGKYRR
jgi:hypothetical protein